MEYLRWDESLRLNHETIDEQHKNLFNLLYELDRAIKESNEESVISGIISSLRDYCKFHFDEEEEFMESINYPDIHFHKVEHEYFRNKVELFEKSIQKRIDKNTIINLITFLHSWLKTHIMDSDKAILDYLSKTLK